MKRQGPWSTSQIDAFLGETRVPVRIACNGPTGHPMLASLWYLHEGDRIWCATRPGARVIEWLRADARCGFEISTESPPYRGIRGTAEASLHTDRGEEILRALLQRYLGDSNRSLAERLLADADREVAIALRPRALFSWDFGHRMEPVP